MEDELLSVAFVLNKKHSKIQESKTFLPSTVISQPMWDKILKFFIEATSGIFQEQMCNMQVCISNFIQKLKPLLLLIIK